MTRPYIPVGRRAVAFALAQSLALSPAAPLFAAPEPAQAQSGPPAPGTKPPAATKPPATATPPAATATPAKAAPAATPAKAEAAPADQGWPRAYATPSGGKILLYQPQVASWTDQKLMVAYAAVSYEAKGATKPALGSLKVEADTRVATTERLVSYLGVAGDRVELPDVAEGGDPRGGGGGGQGDPRLRARDRARPRPRERRQEPDHPEGGEGCEGRSSADLLQQEAGAAREHRRRADLEPDQGERPEVRGQHQLGPLPARSHEGLLPPQRGRAGFRLRTSRAPGRPPPSCPRASGSSRPTTTGKRSRKRCPARRSPRTSCPRCSSASCPPR